ncbi:VOC family protein [Mycolicibacterium psychrotolerans]|uniref:VOC family protein n=1 Tax=Mycolicibacterium psychrotolerans TaxID=216929 RepID=UPI003D67E82D
MGAAAVVYVGDLVRMRTFYERCFGLVSVDNADGEYCVLQSTAWQLTLVQSDEALPATNPPPRRSQTPIKLAMEVASIADTRALAIDLGGGADPITDEWRFGDEIRCDAMDPEGNVVQLIERDTTTETSPVL